VCLGGVEPSQDRTPVSLTERVRPPLLVPIREGLSFEFLTIRNDKPSLARGVAADLRYDQRQEYEADALALMQMLA
jgi:hypothetical protein